MVGWQKLWPTKCQNLWRICEGQVLRFFLFCLIKQSLPFASGRKSFTIASFAFNKNMKSDFYALLQIMKV